MCTGNNTDETQSGSVISVNRTGLIALCVLFLTFVIFSAENHEENAYTLPGKVDNSRLPSFPPIRSQLDLGSCVAWAIAYYQYSHEYARLRDWNIAEGDSTRIFSPKWAYNLTNNGKDDGSSLNDIFRLLRDHGAATLADVPYDTNYREWPTAPHIWESAIRFRSAGTRTFKLVDSKSGIITLRAVLKEGHTPVFRTKIGSWKYSTTRDDPRDPHDDSTIGQEIAYAMDGTRDGHALVVVGYDDHVWVDINENSSVDPGEKGAYLVVNSWGPSFTRNGLVWVAYDAVRARTEVPNWSPPPDRRPLIIGREVYLTIPHIGYIPRVTARFTAVHSKRNQIGFSFITSLESDPDAEREWTPIAFDLRGGAIAFDGSQSRTAAPFILDLSDIAVPDTAIGRYTLEMRDTRPDSPLELTDFSVHFRGPDTSVHFPDPVITENTLRHISIEFQSTQKNHAPVAKFDLVNTDTKTAPCALRFDASSSSDPDGDSLVFSWCFDSSEYAGGEVVSHIFSTAGRHSVQLTATDIHGASSSASMTLDLGGMKANNAPVVNAGPDRQAHPNHVITLYGIVSDDFYPKAEPTIRWEVLQGPGSVTLSHRDSMVTGFTASDTGEYMLVLTADDGDIFVRNHVLVSVLPEKRNLAPFVMLPSDTTLEEGLALRIKARIEDDGLPNEFLQFKWEYVWGTDEPSFTTPYFHTTEVHTLKSGRHRVRLSVSDGELTTHDEMKIEVTPSTRTVAKPAAHASPVQINVVGSRRKQTHIRLRGARPNAIDRITIVDLKGRAVASLRNPKSDLSHEVDFTAQIPPGSFLVLVHTKTRIISRRLVITH